MLSNDISESKKNNEFVFQRDLKEILESIEIKKGKGMEGGGGGGLWKRTSSHFKPMFPPGNTRKSEVLWCFHGVYRGNLCLKWVKGKLCGNILESHTSHQTRKFSLASLFTHSSNVSTGDFKQCAFKVYIHSKVFIHTHYSSLCLASMIYETMYSRMDHVKFVQEGL